MKQEVAARELAAHMDAYGLVGNFNLLFTSGMHEGKHVVFWRIAADVGLPVFISTVEDFKGIARAFAEYAQVAEVAMGEVKRGDRTPIDLNDF